MSFKAVCGSEVIRTIWKSGAQRAAVSDVVPNDWNMNVVAPLMMEKLRFGIRELLFDENDTPRPAAKIPPITCRPHPDKKRKLQIVDGFHRWTILQELGQTEVDVVVLYIDTKTAQLLTAELNYNRGEPDVEKYPAFIARVMREHDVDLDYLAQRLPESPDELRAYLQSADLDLIDINVGTADTEKEQTETRDASETDDLLELKFAVRRSAAEVIQRELARLINHLGGGKNPNGRALEAMAVLSSQTPEASLNALTEEVDEEKISKKRIKKTKRKVRS